MSAMWCPWIAVVALLTIAAPRTTADGEMAPAHSDSAPTHPDGAATHPDGAPMHPDGAATHPDAAPLHRDAATHPDGAATHLDGATAHPDRAHMHPDGASTHPDGADALTDTGPTHPKAAAANADAVPMRAVQRTLNRGASELVWRNWLQSPESTDPAAPPRRITTKSLFVTPHNCADGKRLSGDGCIKVVTVGKEKHETILLEQLNRMAPAAGSVMYDYDESPAAPLDADGPLQLNLPLGPPLTAAASQNMPTRMSPDKKNKPEVDLEAELLKLKLEVDRIKNINNLNKPQTPILHDDYPKVTFDKPKRDNGKVNETTPVPNQDQGQKEVVFGNVSEDTVQYVTLNQTEIKDIKNMLTSAVEHKPDTKANETILVKPNESHNNTKQEHKAENPPEESPNTMTTILTKIEESKVSQTHKHPEILTATQSTHNLEDNEKPAKLHPEVDYSDIGAAVKLISRYAEVTTDDMFKSEQKKYVQEDGPLGTRTKLQHRRRQRPSDVEPFQPSLEDPYARLYPPPPPPQSIYDDRVPSHIVYPKTVSLNRNPRPEYYHYGAQSQRYPMPPSDYPFRHVQEYWARPEQYLGPYAHGNPRRHHHSYAQPPRRARRPDRAGYPAPDLYRLLGLQHWFSGDGAAER